PEGEATARPALQRRVPAFRPVGIACEPDFGKDDQLRTGGGSLRDMRLRAGDGGLLIQKARSFLDNRDFHGFASAENGFPADRHATSPCADVNLARSFYVRSASGSCTRRSCEL